MSASRLTAAGPPNRREIDSYREDMRRATRGAIHRAIP
jgi:hypothetical protein